MTARHVKAAQSLAVLTSEAVAALRSYTDLEKDLTRRLGELEGKLMNLGNYIQPTRDTVARLDELRN